MMRKYLTEPQVEAARSALVEQVERHHRRWGVHGWSFVGAPGRQRLQLRVRRLLHEPAQAITPLELPAAAGGGLLKPDVEASLHRGGHAMPPLDGGTSGGGSAIAQPLAPGSSISVPTGPGTVEYGGVACIVRIGDETSPYLITCGHLFPPDSTGTPVFAGNTQIATLTRNLLDADEPLDGAWCQLTGDGMRLLDQSSEAPTFKSAILAPNMRHQGRKVVFWPTSGATEGPIATRVESTSAMEIGLSSDLWDRLPRLGPFIQSPGVTDHGDSGSLLALGDAYYALCTGRPGRSVFTPLHDVVTRMKSSLDQDVAPWTFDE